MNLNKILLICSKFDITIEEAFLLIRVMCQEDEVERTWSQVFSTIYNKSVEPMAKACNQYQDRLAFTRKIDWYNMVFELEDKELLQVLVHRSKVVDRKFHLADLKVLPKFKDELFVSSATKALAEFTNIYTNNGKFKALEINGFKYPVLDMSVENLFKLYEQHILHGRDKDRHDFCLKITRSYVEDCNYEPKYKISNFIINFDNFASMYESSKAKAKGRRTI